MTQPRQVVPGRTYLITRRTTQRQFLLRPDERTNQIARYCIAEAVARYGLELHVLLVMSNHYHIEVTDVDGVLPQFLRHLNLMLAKALNVRWSRWENLWSVEQACATWLVDDEDKLAKGVYSLVNPTVDHLVERVEDWPGVSSWNAHAHGQTMVVDRPVGFFRDGGRMPAQVELKVMPPRRASGERWPLEDWNRALVSAVRASEQASMAWRRQQGMTILGRGNVRKQSAFDGPKAHEPRRRLRPALACRSRDRRIAELGALCQFRRLHRSASEALLSGDRAVVFPAGTWAQRNLCQRCQPPPASA